MVGDGGPNGPFLATHKVQFICSFLPLNERDDGDALAVLHFCICHLHRNSQQARIYVGLQVSNSPPDFLSLMSVLGFVFAGGLRCCWLTDVLWARVPTTSTQNPHRCPSVAQGPTENQKIYLGKFGPIFWSSLSEELPHFFLGLQFRSEETDPV